MQRNFFSKNKKKKKIGPRDESNILIVIMMEIIMQTTAQGLNSKLSHRTIYKYFIIFNKN